MTTRGVRIHFRPLGSVEEPDTVHLSGGQDLAGGQVPRDDVPRLRVHATGDLHTDRLKSRRGDGDVVHVS